LPTPAAQLRLPTHAALRRQRHLQGNCRPTQIKFDNYPFLLREEIANRRAHPGKPFENEELWYLALSLLEAGRVLHGRGEKVGDVQPGNVFINDNGQAKVACQHSWPHELENYQKTVFEKNVTYLAPEEVKDLHFGLTESKADLALAESFSVGLTLLDSAALTDSTDLYTVSSFRIDYQKLEERRVALRAVGTLDEALRQIVLGLTEVDPKERLACRQVYEWMEQYREKIVNMESFEIRELPPWTKPSERKTLQVLKPHTQPPFYVDSQHYHPIPYEAPRVLYERALPPPSPPQWQPPPPPVQQPFEPFRPQPVPEAYRIDSRVEARPLFPVQADPDVGVYESSYVQVPTSAPSINKPDDFRSTLQKI
jgi:serine/threonine protein kinase